MENILNRGDVVSVVSPKNPKECLIKRVVGLPGDLVKTVNYKSKYVRVPEGHCWIEGLKLWEKISKIQCSVNLNVCLLQKGDNFKKSYDSNAFGCVPMGLVLGQAKLLVNNKIIFPPSFSSIKSHLPTHRKLKKLSNNEHDENFLVDLKSTTNEDEDDDENDDKNENDEN